MKTQNHHTLAARVKVYHGRCHTRKQKNNEKPGSPHRHKSSVKANGTKLKARKSFYRPAGFNGGPWGLISCYQHFQKAEPVSHPATKSPPNQAIFVQPFSPGTGLSGASNSKGGTTT